MGRALMRIKASDRHHPKSKFMRSLRRNWELYLIALPSLLSLLLFSYKPMYGILIAFKDYNPGLGIMGSPWVGFKYFTRFFSDPYCFRLIRNTVLLGLYTLAFGFPAPIILALLLNEVKNNTLKRCFQTISYLPNFVSTVIVAGFILDLTNRSSGFINNLIFLLGGERIDFMTNPAYFRPIYIISGIWQTMGYNSILYLAAISGINTELYEAAYIDGAGRWKQMLHITLPGISSTVTILFILAVGGILGNDFQKILLLYNETTYETADVISTYIYRNGILGGSLSYSTAVGLTFSVFSCLMLLLTNYVVKKLGDSSLF